MFGIGWRNDERITLTRVLFFGQIINLGYRRPEALERRLVIRLTGFPSTHCLHTSRNTALELGQFTLEIIPPWRLGSHLHDLVMKNGVEELGGLFLEWSPEFLVHLKRLGALLLDFHQDRLNLLEGIVAQAGLLDS